MHSVVIEELTKWKAILFSRNEDFKLCVKGLLDEVSLIQKNHLKTLKYAIINLSSLVRSISLIFDLWFL